MTGPTLSVVPAQLPLLKKLWDAGLSAVECGVELGMVGEQGIIREAILRAVEEMARPREKATSRARAVQRREPDARSNLPQRMRTPASNDDEIDPMFRSDGHDGSPAPADLEIPIKRRRSLLGRPYSVYPARAKKQCGWPVGEPKSPEFFYCGDTAHEDEHYCLHHCRIAYNGRLHRQRAA